MVELIMHLLSLKQLQTQANSMFKQFKWILFLFAIAFGIYVRLLYTYESVPDKKLEALAQKHVEAELEKQVQKVLMEQRSVVGENSWNQLVSAEVKQAIHQDQKQYNESIEIAKKAIKSELNHGRSRHYLLESDPYFYFHLVKKLQREGSLFSIQKSGKFFDPDREWPRGAWTPKTWHPYLGYAWVQFLKLFSHKIEVMEVLCYFPLILMIISALAFLFLCRSIQMGFFEILFGMITLLLAPIYIQRSAFGWFDTDPYQVIFPALILGLYLRSFNNGSVPLVFVSGILTAVYSMFWGGWFFVFGLVVATTVTSIVFLARNRELSNIKNTILIYGIVVFLFSVFLLTAKGFLDSFGRGFEFVQKFSLVDQDIWPNPFLTVGEAGQIDFKKLIFLIGTPFTFVMAAIGVIGLFLTALANFNKRNMFQFTLWSTYWFGASYQAIKTERFSVLVVLPTAVLVSFGFFYSCLAVSRLIPKFKRILFGILSIAFVTSAVISANVSGKHNISQIMNDAWFESLEYLRDHTPLDAVVNSWWPPGYFIASIAERKVLIDGGTQQLRETYWMSKALLAANEKELIGIVRMLNSNGNRAFELLQSQNFSAQDSVETIMRLVSLSRLEAEAAEIGELDSKAKHELINLIFGSPEKPTAYLYIYNDLVEQNLALSLMANWDFDKAKRFKSEKPENSQKKITLKAPPLVSFSSPARLFSEVYQSIDMLFAKHATDRYVQEVLKISGPIWKYLPPEPEIGRSGDSVFFANHGEFDQKNNWYRIPGPESEKTKSEPFSLFYVNNNRLIEKLSYHPNRVDVSVLIWEEEGRFYSVLASRELIMSVLFRMFYLNGQTMDYAIPEFQIQDRSSGTKIRIFKIDWNRWNQFEGGNV